MKPFQRLCRFIDWDLGKTGYIRSGAWSLTVGLLLLTIPLVLFRYPYNGTAKWAIVSAVTLCAMWFSFVAWRGFRLMRVSAIRGDRRYDRESKYELATDYHSTESATAASRRGDAD